MDSNLDIFCPLHMLRIEFLNLNKGIKKGQRALSKKCQLFNPTEISEALVIWQTYRQTELECFKQEIDRILEPIINLEKQYQEISKTLMQAFNVTLKIFHEKIDFIKKQSLKEIEKQDNINSLSHLQNIAENLAEQRKIKMSEGLKLDEESMKKFQLIGNQFLHIAKNLQICAQLVVHQNITICTLINDKYKSKISIEKTSSFRDLKESIQKFDKDWNGNLILQMNSGKILTINDDEYKFSSLISNNPQVQICPLNDERLLFMKQIFEVGSTDMQSLEESLDLQSDKILESQFNQIKAKHSSQNIPPHLFAAINTLTLGEFQKTLNQDLKAHRYQNHLIFLKNFYDALVYCSYCSGKAYRGVSSTVDINQYSKGQLVKWNEVISLSQSIQFAEMFAKNNGIIFEIDVVSAKDISGFSEYSLLILFPYSTFLVLDVIQQKNKSTYIKLREMPYPKSTKIVLWVDYDLQKNYKYAEQTEQKIQDLSFLFCQSTEQAIDLLNNYYWMLYLDYSHFRMILNFKNENITYRAAIQLLDYVFIKKNYQNKVFIYCNKVEELNNSKYQIIFSSNRESLIKFIQLC